MKQSFLFPLFFLAALTANAQIPVALDRLEGRWTSGNIISDWHFTDDYALNNRTFQVINGDTTEISRTYIRADKNGVTSLTYIGADGQNHQFELAVADIYGITWRNVQDGDLPTCLKIERIGLNKYAWNGIGDLLEFKREKENKPKARFGILLGVTQTFMPRSPSFAQTTAVGKQGFEAAASVSISKPQSPLRVNFEAGYKQFHAATPVALKNETGQMVHFQNGKTTNLRYIGILPEGQFGKNAQFSFSTGLIFGLTQASYSQYGFDGVPPANYESMMNTPTPKKHWGLGIQAGIGYKPNLKIAGFRPGFYCRYSYRGLVSAGIKLEL